MDFYWNVFANLGSIEAYMGHIEYRKMTEFGKECSNECRELKGFGNK